MRRIPTIVAALLLFALTAHADPKSWTAVKSRVPADANVVVGIDLAQLAKSPSYALVIQSFLDGERDAKEGLAMVKSGCGIDVMTAITDITIIGKVGKGDHALIAIGLSGVDQTSAMACLQTVAEHDAGGAKVIAKTRGKVTEYSVEGTSKKLYAAWLAKDVVALSDDPFEKGKLDKVLGTKAARGDLKAMLAKVTTTSPVFVAIAKKEKSTDVGGTLKGGYGTVEMSAGSFTGTAHVVMSNAAEASNLEAIVTTGLAEMQPQVAKQLPDLAKVLAAIKVATSGVEVTLTGSITEKLLLTVAPQLDKIF